MQIEAKVSSVTSTGNINGNENFMVRLDAIGNVKISEILITAAAGSDELALFSAGSTFTMDITKV